MLQKTSTRFNIYEGVRVGEVQASTGGDVSCWAWIPGEKNIADWVTRGKNPEEISAESEWFSGPSYMTKSIEEWGLKFGKPDEEQLLPGEKKSLNSHSSSSESESNLIKYENFSITKNGIEQVSTTPQLKNVLDIFVKLSSRPKCRGHFFVGQTKVSSTVEETFKILISLNKYKVVTSTKKTSKQKQKVST